MARAVNPRQGEKHCEERLSQGTKKVRREPHLKVSLFWIGKSLSLLVMRLPPTLLSQTLLPLPGGHCERNFLPSFSLFPVSQKEAQVCVCVCAWRILPLDSAVR